MREGEALKIVSWLSSSAVCRSRTRKIRMQVLDSMRACWRTFFLRQVDCMRVCWERKEAIFNPPPFIESTRIVG